MKQWAIQARAWLEASRKPIPNKIDTIDETLGKKGYAVGFESLINHLNKILPHYERMQEMADPSKPLDRAREIW
jgi:hypothetical protein